MVKVDLEETGHEKWHKLYRYEIPVLHFNGEFVIKNRFDKDKFEKKLIELETTKY